MMAIRTQQVASSSVWERRLSKSTRSVTTIPTMTMIFNCRPSDQKEFEKYGAYKVKDLVEWIYLHIDYLDPDFDKARNFFPKRVVFGDFFDEGQHRCSEYLWAKTTHEEAAKILPNNKKYIDTPGRWDRDALKDL